MKKLALFLAVILLAASLCGCGDIRVPTKPDPLEPITTPEPNANTARGTWQKMSADEAYAMTDIIARVEMDGLYAEVATTGDTSKSIAQTYYYILRATVKEVYYNRSETYGDIREGDKIIIAANSSEIQNASWIRNTYNKEEIIFASDLKMMDGRDSTGFLYEQRLNKLAHFVDVYITGTTYIFEDGFFKRTGDTAESFVPTQANKEISALMEKYGLR